MPAYYNDNDPFVAAWLRQLIADSLMRREGSTPVIDPASLVPAALPTPSVVPATAADYASYRRFYQTAPVILR